VGYPATPEIPEKYSNSCGRGTLVGHDLPPDLQTIVDAWPRLSSSERRAVVLVVSSFGSSTTAAAAESEAAGAAVVEGRKPPVGNTGGELTVVGIPKVVRSDVRADRREGCQKAGVPGEVNNY